ncbi:MAG: TadE/TadG family type IV pilus assembly protein [Acidimicrobiia bacterium]
MIRRRNPVAHEPQRHSNDRGQATVEFALILPLFVTVVVAIIDVTMIVRDQLLADVLARDSARRASQATTADEARDIIEDTISRSARSDAEWRVEIDDDSVEVRVSLMPRTSLLVTSARWLGASQHVVGSARFATEFEIAEQ